MHGMEENKLFKTEHMERECELVSKCMRANELRGPGIYIAYKSDTTKLYEICHETTSTGIRAVVCHIVEEPKYIYKPSKIYRKKSGSL